MGKDVKVRFIASDEVSATLRGMKGKVETFSHSVTKIAAGIGLADSFKAVGRVIKASIEDAAVAYPKLGAGLTKVSNSFQEFRIQAGAAFLEILQPAVPLLEQVLGWATKLATQIPNAFDGFRIVLAEISGWFQSIPSQAAIMFGKLEQAAANFIGGAASGVLSFWGITGGQELAGKLAVHSAMVIASAEKTLAGIEAATDRTIAKYGGTHNYGSRAPTPAEQAALDKARAAAEQALINRQSPYGKPRLASEPIGLRDTTGHVQTNEEAGFLSSAPKELSDFQQGLENVLGPFDEFQAKAIDTTNAVGALADLVGNGMSDAFYSLFESLAAGNNVMASFGKTLLKAVGQVAAQLGRVTIAEGIANIAKGLWGPLGPNPVQVAAGKKQILAGIGLMAVGGSIAGAASRGGSGGGGGYGGSGSLSGSQVDRTGQAVTTRGTLTVTMPRGAIMRAGDPEWQEFLAETMKAGQGRNVEFRYT